MPTTLRDLLAQLPPEQQEMVLRQLEERYARQQEDERLGRTGAGLKRLGTGFGTSLANMAWSLASLPANVAGVEGGEAKVFTRPLFAPRTGLLSDSLTLSGPAHNVGSLAGLIAGFYTGGGPVATYGRIGKGVSALGRANVAGRATAALGKGTGRAITGLLGTGRLAQAAARAGAGAAHLGSFEFLTGGHSLTERTQAALHGAPTGAAFGLFAPTRGIRGADGTLRTNPEEVARLLAGYEAKGVVGSELVKLREPMSRYIVRGGVRAALGSTLLPPMSPLPITGQPRIDSTLFNAAFMAGLTGLHGNNPLRNQPDTARRVKAMKRLSPKEASTATETADTLVHFEPVAGQRARGVPLSYTDAIRETFGEAFLQPGSSERVRLVGEAPNGDAVVLHPTTGEPVLVDPRVLSMRESQVRETPGKTDVQRTLFEVGLGEIPLEERLALEEGRLRPVKVEGETPTEGEGSLPPRVALEREGQISFFPGARSRRFDPGEGGPIIETRINLDDVTKDMVAKDPITRARVLAELPDAAEGRRILEGKGLLPDNTTLVDTPFGPILVSTSSLAESTATSFLGGPGSTLAPDVKAKLRGVFGLLTDKLTGKGVFGKAFTDTTIPRWEKVREVLRETVREDLAGLSEGSLRPVVGPHPLRIIYTESRIPGEAAFNPTDNTLLLSPTYFHYTAAERRLTLLHEFTHQRTLTIGSFLAAYPRRLVGQLFSRMGYPTITIEETANPERTKAVLMAALRRVNPSLGTDPVALRAVEGAVQHMEGGGEIWLPVYEPTVKKLAMVKLNRKGETLEVVPLPEDHPDHFPIVNVLQKTNRTTYNSTVWIEKTPGGLSPQRWIPLDIQITRAMRVGKGNRLIYDVENKNDALFSVHPSPVWLTFFQGTRVHGVPRIANSYYGYTNPGEFLAELAIDYAVNPDPAFLEARFPGLQSVIDLALGGGRTLFAQGLTNVARAKGNQPALLDLTPQPLSLEFIERLEGEARVDLTAPTRLEAILFTSNKDHTNNPEVESYGQGLWREPSKGGKVLKKGVTKLRWLVESSLRRDEKQLDEGMVESEVFMEAEQAALEVVASRLKLPPGDPLTKPHALEDAVKAAINQTVARYRRAGVEPPISLEDVKTATPFEGVTPTPTPKRAPEGVDLNKLTPDQLPKLVGTTAMDRILEAMNQFSPETPNAQGLRRLLQANLTPRDFNTVMRRANELKEGEGPPPAPIEDPLPLDTTVAPPEAVTPPKVTTPARRSGPTPEARQLRVNELLGDGLPGFTEKTKNWKKWQQQAFLLRYGPTVQDPATGKPIYPPTGTGKPRSMATIAKLVSMSPRAVKQFLSRGVWEGEGDRPSPFDPGRHGEGPGAWTTLASGERVRKRTPEGDRLNPMENLAEEAFAREAHERGATPAKPAETAVDGPIKDPVTGGTVEPDAPAEKLQRWISERVEAEQARGVLDPAEVSDQPTPTTPEQESVSHESRVNVSTPGLSWRYELGERPRAKQTVPRGPRKAAPPPESERVKRGLRSKDPLTRLQARIERAINRFKRHGLDATEDFPLLPPDLQLSHIVWSLGEATGQKHYKRALEKWRGALVNAYGTGRGNFPIFRKVAKGKNQQQRVATVMRTAPQVHTTVEFRGSSTHPRWEILYHDSGRVDVARDIGTVALLLDLRAKQMALGPDLSPPELDGIRISIPGAETPGGGGPRKPGPPETGVYDGETGGPPPATPHLDRGLYNRFLFFLRNPRELVERLASELGRPDIAVVGNEVITATTKAHTRAETWLRRVDGRRPKVFRFVGPQGTTRKEGALQRFGIDRGRSKDIGSALAEVSRLADEAQDGALKNGATPELAFQAGERARQKYEPQIFNAFGIRPNERAFIEWLRSDFFEPLRKIFGIQHRRAAYFPWLRQRNPLAETREAEDVQRMKSRDVNFWADFARSGATDTFERNVDLLRVLDAYVRAGFRYKYLGAKVGGDTGAIGRLNLLIDSLSGEGETIPFWVEPLIQIKRAALGVTDPTRARHLQSRDDRHVRQIQRLNRLAERVDRSKDPVRRLTAKVIQRMTDRLGDKLNENDSMLLADYFLALNRARVFGLHVMRAVRHVSQSFFTVYPRVGARHYVNAIRSMLNPRKRAWILARARAAGAIKPAFEVDLPGRRGLTLKATDALTAQYTQLDLWERGVSFEAMRTKTRAAIESYRKHGDIARFRRESSLSLLSPMKGAASIQALRRGDYAAAERIASTALVDHSIFDYTRANQPEWSRGVWGKLFGQYGRWPLNMLENMHGMVRYGSPAERATVAGRYALAAATVYGVGQLLGVETGGWIPFVHTLNYNGGPLFDTFIEARQLASGDPDSANRFEANWRYDPVMTILSPIFRQFVPVGDVMEGLAAEVNGMRHKWARVRIDHMMGIPRRSRTRQEVITRVLGFRPSTDPTRWHNPLEALVASIPPIPQLGAALRGLSAVSPLSAESQNRKAKARSQARDRQQLEVLRQVMAEGEEPR